MAEISKVSDKDILFFFGFPLQSSTKSYNFTLAAFSEEERGSLAF